MTNDGTYTYSYDSEGRPVNISGVSATYDALGRLVEYNNGGSYTQTVYAPSGDKFAYMTGQSVQQYFAPLERRSSITAGTCSSTAFPTGRGPIASALISLAACIFHFHLCDRAGCMSAGTVAMDASGNLYGTAPSEALGVAHKVPVASSGKSHRSLRLFCAECSAVV